MKFDKSKILTVVTADQAKVGQKGWFASNVETLSRLVLEEQPKELLGFDSNNAVHAFRTSFQNHALFYPAPEPTYALKRVVEGGRMKVKDLIEKLQICNKEAEVSIIVDGDSTKKLPLQVWAGGETYGELCGLEDCKHVFLAVSLSGRSTENKE